MNTLHDFIDDGSEPSHQANGRYHCIMIDPPWPQYGGGKICRGAQTHYTLMSIADITALTKELISQYADEEACHMWMWTTSNQVPDALQIITECDFRYITNLVWVKNRIGIGQYLRTQHELCLFAVRGNAMLPIKRDVPSVFFADKKEHSHKPDEAYKIIKRVSPGRYLSIFERSQRNGWDIWGDEAPR